MTELLILILLSLVVGLLMGILGGGGGGFYLAITVIFLHDSVRTAVGTALLLSSITLLSASWHYWRQKKIRYDYFFVIGLSGIAGTISGSFFMHLISEQILKIFIIIFFVLSGLSSLYKMKEKNDALQLPDAKKKLFVIIPIGLLAGFITGAFGLSGSTALSSLLIGTVGMQPSIAVGTTIPVALILNLSGGLLHWVTTGVDVKTLAILGVGSVFGAVFGSKLALKINRRLLALILGVTTIASGIYLFWHN